MKKYILEVKEELKGIKTIELENFEEARDEIADNITWLLIPSDRGDALYEDINDRDFDMLEFDLKLGYKVDMYDDIEAFVKVVRQIYEITEDNQLPQVIDACNKLYEKLGEKITLSIKVQ